MGCVGGLVGALFVKLNIQISDSAKRMSVVEKGPVLVKVTCFTVPHVSCTGPCFNRPVVLQYELYSMSCLVVYDLLCSVRGIPFSELRMQMFY